MIKTTEANRLAADAAAAASTAWISFVEAESVGWHKEQIPFVRFPFIFKNVGKTPALNVEITWGFTVVEDGGKRPVYKTCPTTYKQTPGTVYADQPVRSAVQYPLTETQLVRLMKEFNISIYIHGCIKYADVFGAQDRLTEIAFIYPAKDKSGFNFAVDSPYNRMK